MGLFNRIWRVIRANINHLVGRAEDPEKILEQAVSDMQDDLIQLRQAVAQAIASQKRTERQQAQAQNNADEWHRRAQLALQKGDETLAREALTRRKSYQETAAQMKAQLQGQEGVVAKLKENMRTLEGKLSEAKTKKDMYIARARSAQASQQLSDLLGHTRPGGAMAAFERMEERVMELEAQSEAFSELGADDLEKQFNSLEAGGEIDDELKAMKAQLSGSDSSAQLPAGQSQSQSGQSQSQSDDELLDRELKQMRSELDRS
jgi:phage shock protein A